MTTFLRRSMNWLSSTLADTGVAGESIIYQRGSESLSIIAVVGQSESTQVDASGVSYSVATTDFMISASDLVFGGETVEPAERDRIIWDGRVYIVAQPTGGDRPFRSSGNDRSLWRVHTKCRGAE